MLGISNDMFGDRVVRPYVTAKKITFPMALDQQMVVSRQYGIVSLPTTILIDPQGIIIGFEPLIQLFERGHFNFTWATPCGPEIDQEIFTSKLPKAYFLSTKILQSKVAGNMLYFFLGFSLRASDR